MSSSPTCWKSQNGLPQHVFLVLITATPSPTHRDLEDPDLETLTFLWLFSVARWMNISVNYMSPDWFFLYRLHATERAENAVSKNLPCTECQRLWLSRRAIAPVTRELALQSFFPQLSRWLVDSEKDESQNDMWRFSGPGMTQVSPSWKRVNPWLLVSSCCIWNLNDSLFSIETDLWHCVLLGWNDLLFLFLMPNIPYPHDTALAGKNSFADM